VLVQVGSDRRSWHTSLWLDRQVKDDLSVIYFLGKCYAPFGEPELILKMPSIPIAIFLSSENAPFDSLHLREIWRQPRIKFGNSKFRLSKFSNLFEL
jgi:hypothetical protein